MNTIDLVIVFLAMTAVLQGLELGFFRQLGSLAGFWAGFIVGLFLAPSLVSGIADPAIKATVALLIILFSAFLFGSLGKRFGDWLATWGQIFHIGWLDAVLGAVVRTGTTLIVFWLVAVLFFAAPSPALRHDLQQSRILQGLNASLPPVPLLVTRMRGAISATGFPQVFSGLEPLPAASVEVPLQADLAQAVAADEAGVVKIEGVACDQITAGSGFVAAPDVVVTNAHVVASVDYPSIEDSSGKWHTATTVYFDPLIDVAVLRSSGLPTVLPLASGDAVRGTAGTVMGYPEAGPFQAVPAGVRQRVEATGNDIYERGTVTREIYELQARVEPGNSGGPLVSLNGQVLGLVFARSATDNQTGYALALSQILPGIHQGESATAAVTTGVCTNE